MNVSITKRTRGRTNTDGKLVRQVRFIVNYREPGTDIRRQLFFDKLKLAQDKRVELVSAVDRNSYVRPVRNSLTVADIVSSWLEAKRVVLKPNTIPGYEARCRLIVGPLLPAYARQALIRSGVGAVPRCESIPLLSNVKVSEITTRQIRSWHALIASEVGIYSANKAAMLFKAALSVAAEDGGFRPPAFPTGLQRRADRPAKLLLTSAQIALIIEAAKRGAKSVYCAFPFLTGVRSSEMLGLLWSDVDFDRGVIRIRRIQSKRSGELVDATKTAAGTRSIPMSPVLRDMLALWRVRCPPSDRVFPAPEGGPLFYNNYRTRYWLPTLGRLGLPAVSPHSARHSFVSTLQAQGVDVGTVAKLAGHKSAAVTLSFYTHSVSDLSNAVGFLDRAFVTDAVTEQLANACSGCIEALD